MDHPFPGKFHKSGQRFIGASLHQDLGRRLLLQQVGLVVETATLDEYSENQTIIFYKWQNYFL